MPFCILGVFVFSRMLFWSAGARFDAFPLLHFWQYLDLPVLRHDLLRGLWYLHSQSPAFNLFLGLGLKVLPDPPEVAFATVFRVLGYLSLLCMYGLLRLGGMGRWFALPAVCLFAVSPGALLYENWLFYTLPVALLLLLAALGLARYEQTGRPRYAGLHLAAMTALCLTRASFHPLVLGVCVALLRIARPERPPVVLRGSLAALAVVLAWSLKNAVLFGVFGASSWTGMNLWRVAGAEVPDAVLHALVAEGALPAIVLQKPFDHVSKYPEEYARVPARYAEIPSLANAQKQGTWVKNLNHYGYIRISRAYGAASSYVIRNRFGDYARSVGAAWEIYARPSWDFEFVRRNVAAARPLIAVYSLGLLGPPAPRGAIAPEGRMRCRRALRVLLAMAAACAIVGAGVLCLRGGARRRAALGTTLAFMVFTVLYVAVVGNAFERGENNRFRVETDPLLYLSVLLVLRHGAAALRAAMGVRQ